MRNNLTLDELSAIVEEGTRDDYERAVFAADDSPETIGFLLEKLGSKEGTEYAIFLLWEKDANQQVSLKSYVDALATHKTDDAVSTLCQMMYSSPVDFETVAKGLAEIGTDWAIVSIAELSVNPERRIEALSTLVTLRNTASKESSKPGIYSRAFRYAMDQSMNEPAISSIVDREETMPFREACIWADALGLAPKEVSYVDAFNAAVRVIETQKKVQKQMEPFSKRLAWDV